ncbi:MAG: hypothetical protein AABX19_02725 [Nanoarchaeota archaeon]
MARKKKSESTINSLLNTTEKGLHKIDDIIQFQKRMRRYIIAKILTFLGIIVLIYGIIILLASYFPGIRPGVIALIIGIALVIIAALYKNIHKI